MDRAGALDSRDALAKEIYNRLFDWLVKRVNSSMDHAYAMTKSVGVLDIFGFEVLDSNSFEQMCINYANEKLHQMFVNNYFKVRPEGPFVRKVDAPRAWMHKFELVMMACAC